MHVLVALALTVALSAARAAPPTTSPASAAALTHQMSPGSLPDAEAPERHGLPRSINEEAIQTILPKRRSERTLVDSWQLDTKYSQNLPHKKNIFVIRNERRREESTQNTVNPNLRVLKADGREIIFGILTPQLKVDRTNLAPPATDLDKSNKAFNALEKRRLRGSVHHFFFLPRSSFQSSPKGVNQNELSGEINFSEAFYRRLPLVERIQSDKSLINNYPSLPSRSGAGRRVRKRSPLELGLVPALGGAHVTHHGSGAHASAHHSVVLHPPKAPHAVQVGALHGVAGLVTHAVVDPALHITSTTVFTHDKPLAAAAVIPVVVKHELVALAHPAHSLFRAHVGGFGVGIDFGGHGAGHGFYAASAGFGFR